MTYRLKLRPADLRVAAPAATDATVPAERFLPDLEFHLDVDIDELLAAHKQVAVIWSAEDVQDVRPALTEDQCWEVVDYVRRKHDATLGISWHTLEIAADDLFDIAASGDA